jgi:hypothetical protein
LRHLCNHLSCESSWPQGKYRGSSATSWLPRRNFQSPCPTGPARIYGSKVRGVPREGKGTRVELDDGGMGEGWDGEREGDDGGKGMREMTVPGHESQRLAAWSCQRLGRRWRLRCLSPSSRARRCCIACVPCRCRLYLHHPRQMKLGNRRKKTK